MRYPLQQLLYLSVQLNLPDCQKVNFLEEKLQLCRNLFPTGSLKNMLVCGFEKLKTGF